MSTEIWSMHFFQKIICGKVYFKILSPTLSLSIFPIFSDFASHDRKYLQKSIANLMEMCELVMSTLDLVDNKKWLNQPKPKEKSKDKKKR